MVFDVFSERLKKIIKEKGFLEPTLPQKMGIPVIMSGENVLIIAPTGMGKTETVMLPIFDIIHKDQKKPISALYISPLRSLNRDLLDRLFWWADKMDIEIGVRHGDTTNAERTSQREAPPHILITTPESLQAMITGKILRGHLANIRHVIIDEIHEIVESKRGTQLAVMMERLQRLTGPFQRIGISATIGSPERVAEFLGKEVKIIRAESEKKYKISVENPKPVVEDKEKSDELFIGVETTARIRKLHNLITSHDSVLVFTNTRETAEVLSSRLRNYDRELKHSIHHGSLSRESRITSEQKFKAGELKSLIATSSLELGIDIGSIDLVVQYLSPRQVTRLIQRVGRSGHKVGHVSKGIIITGDEDIFESSVIAKRAMKKELEEVKIHESALDVLANQIIGMCIEEFDIPDSVIYETVVRSYPFRDLKKTEFLEVLKFLESLRLLWLNPSPHGYNIKRSRKAWLHYFNNLSTIPTNVQYKIISIIENEPIGNLDEGFIAEYGQPGSKFVVSGRAWKIIQVNGNKVTVEPIEDIESAIPAWQGELIPVPYVVAQEVGKLRRTLKSIDPLGKEMQKIIELQKKTHIIPDEKTFLVENYKDFVIIHSCCGSLVNDTIGRYLGAILTNETGVAVNIKNDPYRIMIQSISTPENVVRILKEGAGIRDTVALALERSSLFKYRFLQVAKRFGIISKDARLDKININKILTTYVGTPAYKETMREIFLDKMDIERAESVLERIRKDEIKIVFQPGLSYLGEIGLTRQFSEVIKPRQPEKEILNAFKKRLMYTRIRLVCVHCGDYTLIKSVKNIEKQPECPKCSSRLIAIVGKNHMSSVEVVKKRLKKKELSKEESYEFVKTRRSADLVMVYGKKAAIALAARGIGPQTAARILAAQHLNTEKFLQAVLNAEKEFARTKKYWK